MTSVNKILANIKVVDRMKMNKNIKKILKPIIFLTFAILPFISATQTMSMDTFLDSFENPEFYICIDSNNHLIQSAANDGDYIIIQKSSHPEFNLENNDNIIYIKNQGELACELIHHTNFIGGIKRYYTTDENNQLNEKPIYEGQGTFFVLSPQLDSRITLILFGSMIAGFLGMVALGGKKK